MSLPDSLEGQLGRLVTSAALALESGAAAFVVRSSDQTLASAAEFGPPCAPVTPSDFQRLSQAIARASDGVLIVDDVRALGATATPWLPRWSGQPAQSFAAVHVGDAVGEPVGVLLVADAKRGGGLSAAKRYVLLSLAAQIAVRLRLDALAGDVADVNHGDEERLRLLESVVVNAKDSILITEAEPFDLPGPRIVYCNAAFTETTGYAFDEVIGRTPRLLQGPGTDALGRARIRAALGEWKPIEIEVLNYKKSGEPFWVELSIVPVANASGWYTHWVSVQRDITQRKNLDEIQTRARIAEANNARLETLTHELQVALDAAQAANVAKSQFLANMSHEIRTPLNGVLGMTQALWADDLTEIQRERVSLIRESGQSLLAVLNDVLDLAKIEAGRLELETLDFDLEAAVRGVCAVFAEQARAADVAFRFDLDPNAAGVWRGDSVRLRQILYNLVSNALKFTPKGSVAVALDVIAAGSLRIRVRDTGVGISPEGLTQLFSKFYQSDSSNTRRYGGTGLGLAICRELCELMGGSIHAESVEGSGSTFCVVLPLAQVARGAPVVEAVRAAIEPEGSLAGLRVLAAEDNVANQLVLRALLQSFGVTPTIVGDGALALETWEREPFDLVLMDIQMPILDGVAATRAIRDLEARRALPRTRIVAVTANVMTHQVRGYLDAGMDGHLGKPLDIDRLAEVLRAESAQAPTAERACA